MRRLALLLLVPACLSRPEGRHQPSAIGAWPPPDVDIVAARVLDHDGDGIDDLVLASASPTTPALYVLLGTRAGIGAGYHATIATSAPPLAIAVGDVSGDGTADLVALELVSPTSERLEAFPTTDLVTFAAPWRADTTELSTLAPARATLEVLDFEPDGIADVFVADELHVAIGRTTAATEIGFGDMVIAPLSEIGTTFAAPVSAFTQPAAGGGRDLVAVSAFRTGVYAQIGAGPPTLHQPERTTVFSIHARCDLDGDGTLEVVGGHGAWAAETPWPVAREALYDDAPFFGGSGDVPAATCAQLDHDPAGRLDLAVLFRPEAGGQRVTVLPDLQLVTAPPGLRTSRAATLDFELPAARADVMVDGDFDGDGTRELVVVAHDGTITCLTAGADALTPCAP